MSEQDGQEQNKRIEHDAAKDDTVPPAMTDEDQPLTATSRKEPTGSAKAASTSEGIQAAGEKNTSAPEQAPGGPVAAGEAAQVPEDDTEPEERRKQAGEAANAKVLATSRQHTRRSFIGAAAATAAGVGFYSYLNVAPREAMQPVPLAGAYSFNEVFSRGLLPQQALAPTYPLSRAENLRINGVYGLKQDLVLNSWRLQLVGTKNAAQHPRFVPDVTGWDYQYMKPPANEDKGHDTKVDPSKEAGAALETGKDGPPPASGQCPPDAPADNERNGGKGAPRGTMPKMVKSTKPAGPGNDESREDDNHTGRKPRGMEEAGESDSTLPPHTPGLLLQMPDITRLPRVEVVTQFKCIEGWSQIVHWAGVRMADFLELYPPAPIDGKEPKYVYMETPDGDYYTGYDLAMMRHPQTLLVTEMMGAPLTQNHGAPLRLHMPTKYGYKQIKRIGLIAYTNTKPDDYWTKLGYDWYAGL